MKFLKFLRPLFNNYGMATDMVNASRTGSTLGDGAQFDYVVPQTWQQRIHHDVWYICSTTQWEGGTYVGYGDMTFNEKNDKYGAANVNGGAMTGMPIMVKGWNGLNGDEVKISVNKGIFPAFKKNDTELVGSEVYMKFGQFSVGLDYYRCSIGFNAVVDYFTITKNPELAYFNLRNAAARKKDQLFYGTMLFSGASKATNATSFTTPTTYAGSSTTSATVISNEAKLDVESIKKLYAKLKSQGAPGISISKINMGNGKPDKVVPQYVMLYSDIDDYNLGFDSDYDGYLKEAGERGQLNPLFSNAVLSFKNMYLYPVPDPDQGSFRIGNPLRPAVNLSTTTDTSTGTWTVGSDSQVDYTQFFPSTGNLIVYNSAGETVEVVTYSAKTATTFTISARAVAGTATAHASGTEVSLNTGRVLAMGSLACLKTTGPADAFIKQKEDYDLKQGLGIGFWVGYMANLDSAGAPKNYAVLETFSTRDFS